MGGYGVAIVGHSNAKVVAAITRQAETLITCHGSLYNDAAEFPRDPDLLLSEGPRYGVPPAAAPKP